MGNKAPQQPCGPAPQLSSQNLPGKISEKVPVFFPPSLLFFLRFYSDFGKTAEQISLFTPRVQAVQLTGSQDRPFALG